MSSIEPRFQLFHVTVGLLTDCELEPNLVSVNSVDNGTKPNDFLLVVSFTS